MKKNMRNAIAASVSAMALICVAEAAGSDLGFERADDSVALEWNIPAQPLTDALIAWSDGTAVFLEGAFEVVDDPSDIPESETSSNPASGSGSGNGGGGDEGDCGCP